VDLSLVLLIAASVAQLAAAILALRLVPVSGGRGAWGLVAAAMLLMVLRRWLHLAGPLGGAQLGEGTGLAADVVSLLISLLLLVGLLWLRPTFQLRQEESARVKLLASHLAASETQQQELISSLPVAVVVLIDGRIAFANSSFEDAFGLPPAAALGSSLEELIAPQHRDAFRTWLDSNHGTSGNAARSEWPVAGPDGQQRWVALRCRTATWQGSPALLVTAADITAAKVAAQRLEESEARFRALTEGTASAILIYQDTGIRYVNNAAVELTGYSREEFAAMNFWDIVHPEHRELVKARGLARQQGDAPPRRYQFKIVRKDGAVRWIDFSADSITFEGRPAGIGAAFDITRQKQIEEELQASRARLEELVAQRTAELRESEERFRALAENSLDVIMRFDRSFRHLYANPIVESQTGIPAREFIGKTHRELGFPEELCAFWEEAMDAVFRTGRTHRVEFQLPSRIWIDWLLIPETRPDGSVASVITAARDITERKQAEEELRRHRDHLAELVEEATAELREANQQLNREIRERQRVEAALRQSEARYRSLYDNATIGLYRTTPDGRIELANPAMVRMLGFSSFEELAQRDVETVGFTEEFPRQRFKELLERQGEVIGLEYPMRRADGTLIWVRENARVVRAEDGRIAYYEGTVEDTTQRRILEERLRQAEKMEALGTCAGGVAHDFNNLLMATRGAADLLAKQIGDNRAAQAELDIIRRAVARGAELANALLVFARRRALEMQEMQISQVVTELLPMLQRVLPENIAIESFDQGAGTVRGDRGQLEQILMNLASNARDAMPRGGTITIHTSSVSLEPGEKAERLGLPPGPYVKLSFRDTGVGMDPETQARAFEPFFTTKAPGSGTGLGLATVYGLVQQHGGAIQVESAVGVGTRVDIYLPQITPSSPAPSRPPEPPTQGGSETILVVEDEGDVRHVLVEALTSFGYTVLAAEDGEAALEILQSQGERIQLVVTDVVMPRMGGLELRAAATAVAPRTRFLFSSGYSDSLLLDSQASEQGDGFIGKPYGVDQLARKVREILDRPSPTTPAPPPAPSDLTN